MGGIPLQIEDGVSGYLVHSGAECAQRASDILADPERPTEMARCGKEHVRLIS